MVAANVRAGTAFNSVYPQTRTSCAGLRSARSAMLPTPHYGTLDSSGLAAQVLISCCPTSDTPGTLGARIFRAWFYVFARRPWRAKDCVYYSKKCIVSNNTHIKDKSL